MKLKPFAKRCGILVEDVQLSDLDSQQFDELRQAFGDHGLLFFRDQQLQPQHHLQFAHRFGDVVLNKFFKPVDDYPEIAEVRKEPDQTMNIGGGWHTDHTYDQEPATGSILVARELPEQGGNTRFANLAAAYEDLSTSMKKRLSGLQAVHSNAHIYGKGGYYESTDQAALVKGENVGRAVHPVVVEHPLSGKPVLYVNPAHVIAIEGMAQQECEELLKELFEHVDQPEYTCSFDWRPGSVAFWDNRATWHFANNDYHGQRRVMHRITLAGGALKAA